MRLSTKGRYAVMAMADLAGQAPSTGSHERSKPVALADIADDELRQALARLGAAVTKP